MARPTRMVEVDEFLENDGSELDSDSDSGSFSLSYCQRLHQGKGQILAIKWKDKRDVYVLSTADKSEMVPIEGRAAELAGGHQIVKPAAVIRYNNNKAGWTVPTKCAHTILCTGKRWNGGRRCSSGCSQWR